MASGEQYCQRRGGHSNMNMVKDHDSKKPSRGFDKRKCYACSKVGHFAWDKILQLRVKCMLNAVIKDTG